MLNIVYNSNQSVDPSIVVLSPSTFKPKLVVEDALKHFSGKVFLESGFRPCSPEQLCQVHDRKFVEDILSLKRNNGFGTTHKEIADSLLWTNGSFYAAAKRAFLFRSVTMSPTSGFHHAGYETPEGFCTFNGLALSALMMHQEFNINIGIIDYDAHYGNGTDEIIRKKNMTYVQHDTFGKYAPMMMGQFSKWLAKLDHSLEKNFSESDMLFYQAGADPHVDDPYGGYLSTEEMFERDLKVFKFAKRTNKPLVWNLAGGYQKPIEKVLQLHRNTFKAYFEIYGA